MNINLEVFDKEVLENIITCLNFKMDKVIFFGQEDTMTEELKNLTEIALKKHCDVHRVVFETVSMKDIDRVQETITDVVKRETKAGGKCYFDLTGGADMVLVAMGMYSATHNIPMHRYDLHEQELKILNTDADHIDQCVEARQIPLTIDELVKLQGGVVDYTMQKRFKDGLDNPEFREDVEALWGVANCDMRVWNSFSSVLKATKTTTEGSLAEWLSRDKVGKIAAKNNSIGNEGTFVSYLNRLDTAGCIENLKIHDEWISFRYKSDQVRGCLLDAGSILELHTYYDRLESGLYGECKIGTHLKWGVNAADDGFIVNNEIDVLCLRGYTMTFISCKAGDPDQMALYELDTVASRFGGKFARRELVTAGNVEFHHAQRAKEMEITVVQV